MNFLNAATNVAKATPLSNTKDGKPLFLVPPVQIVIGDVIDI